MLNKKRFKETIYPERHELLEQNYPGEHVDKGMIGRQ